MPLTAIREFSVACRLGQDPAQVSNAREQARTALPGWSGSTQPPTMSVAAAWRCWMA
jgi:hypothetical protein